MFVSQQDEPEQTLAEWNAAREANEARQAVLQASINAAQAELTALIAEHERLRYWADHSGILSETGYQTWKHGHTPSSARQLISTGVALEELPQVRASFEKGELCLAQVRVLKDICESETETRLLEFAHGMSGAQLSRFASHYRSALKVEQDRSHTERFLKTHHTHDGSWVISGRLSSHQGAVVDKAIEKAIELARADGAEKDDAADDPWAAEAADALVSMSESLLAHGLEERPAPERYQVVIDIDLDTLGTDGIAKIRDGGIVSARTAEMILCDASIVETISKAGDLLDLGRKHRFPTTPLRRALAARDRCCAFPGCHRTLGLENHHDDEWSKGGETKLTKMRRFCRMHHVKWHLGEFTVEETPDGAVYRDRGGKVIERSPLQVDAKGGGINRLIRDRGIVVDESTCLPEWGGERGSLRYVADVALEHRAWDLEEAERQRKDSGPHEGGPSP